MIMWLRVRKPDITWKHKKLNKENILWQKQLVLT